MIITVTKALMYTDAYSLCSVCSYLYRDLAHLSLCGLGHGRYGEFRIVLPDLQRQREFGLQ